MIFGGQNSYFYKEFMKMSEFIQNPFSAVYYWAKSQISDIKAMRDAIQSRDNVISVCQKVNAKKQSLKKEYDSSAHGRTTLKTFFKSNNEKQTYHA